MPRRKKWVLFFLVVMAGLILFYPIQVTVVPEWKLRVVDQTGEGLRGNAVRESWCHYTLESQCHEQDLVSDAEGYVWFPRRMIRTNLIIWFSKLILRLPNVHSSYGPSASIYYLGDFRLISEEPWYRSGRPLAEQIVVWRPR